MDSRIETSKDRAVSNMEYFLRNFSHIPDDKLNWKATPTAKSAIRIAAHTALYAGRFAQMVRDRALPKFDNLEDWIAQRNAEEEALTDRNEMERVFREGTDEFVAALETLTPEDLELTLDSGVGFTMPMTQVINFAGWHATLHSGQIDFLQTCWDDQEVYF